MVKCESLRINMFRITHTGKSVNFPVTVSVQQAKQTWQLDPIARSLFQKVFKKIQFLVMDSKVYQQR